MRVIRFLGIVKVCKVLPYAVGKPINQHIRKIVARHKSALLSAYQFHIVSLHEVRIGIVVVEDVDGIAVVITF